MKTIKLTLEDGKIVEFRHGEDEPSIVSEIRKGLNEHSFRIYNTLYLGVTLMLKEWFDEHAMDSQKVIKAEYLMNGEIIDT